MPRYKLTIECPHCSELQALNLPTKRRPPNLRLTCLKGFGEYCVLLVPYACDCCGRRNTCLVEEKVYAFGNYR